MSEKQLFLILWAILLSGGCTAREGWQQFMLGSLSLIYLSLVVLND